MYLPNKFQLKTEIALCYIQFMSVDYLTCSRLAIDIRSIKNIDQGYNLFALIYCDVPRISKGVIKINKK